jgi:hypothetical protein
MQQTVKAPLYFWIISVVSLLWNSVGAFDFSASQLRLDFYMSQFTPEQLAWFTGFPTWAVIAWGLGVWGAFLGSLALLLRKSLAVLLFGLSLLGLLGTTVYNFVLTDGMEGSGLFTAVIWVIAIALLIYAQAMEKRKILS